MRRAAPPAAPDATRRCGPAWAVSAARAATSFKVVRMTLASGLVAEVVVPGNEPEAAAIAAGTKPSPTCTARESVRDMRKTPQTHRSVPKT